MTANPFAALLDGVARHTFLSDDGHLEYFLPETDVLAALSAAVPADLAEAGEVADECFEAVSGEGPRAFDWTDKPHRLVYDMYGAIRSLIALATAQAARIEGLEAERDEAEQRGYANAMDAERKLHEASLAASEARVAKLVEALNEARDQDRDPDYCHDEKWDYTQSWSEWSDLLDHADLREPTRIYTLYRGPTKWVVQVPLDADSDGETDDVEIRMFDSEEAARAAIEEAKK